MITKLACNACGNREVVSFCTQDFCHVGFCALHKNLAVASNCWRAIIAERK